jgi:hypothetical protein
MNNNKIVDLTFDNIEEIIEFTFILKGTNFYEKLLYNWNLTINKKNKKKIDILKWKKYK